MVSITWKRLWLAYQRLYNVKKLIKYAIKTVFNCKMAPMVGVVGCGIFKTRTVMIIAIIASKNVSNLVVSMGEYLIVLI